MPSSCPTKITMKHNVIGFTPPPPPPKNFRNFLGWVWEPPSKFFFLKKKKKKKGKKNPPPPPKKNTIKTKLIGFPPPPPHPHQRLLGYFWWEFEELVNRFLFNFSHFVVYFIAHRENIWFVERG